MGNYQPGGAGGKELDQIFADFSITAPEGEKSDTNLPPTKGSLGGNPRQALSRQEPSLKCYVLSFIMYAYLHFSHDNCD